MSEGIAISLKNVSKVFRRYRRPVERLKEILIPGKSRAEEFWALRNINLEIPKGETLGIIGRNGSGKSTLLQIIAGTLTPTTGELELNGRVSALLELGSGFNPEFTGRQNVFFNGRVLGLSQEEVAEKFDQIAAFADIGDFIDQPIKTYSSGMVVRLAFAVVAHTEPSILIVDEALAVGDAKFQAKCIKRIRDMKNNGVTLLFVSHDSSSVQMLCHTAVLMNKGEILSAGNPKNIINEYIALISSDERAGNKTLKVGQTHETQIQEEYLKTKRHGNELIKIRNVQIQDEDGQVTTKIQTGSTLSIPISFEAEDEASDLVVGISIRNLMGLVVYGTNTLLLNIEMPKVSRGQAFEVSFNVPCFLNKGIYSLTVAIHSMEGVSHDWIDDILIFEVINSNNCHGLVDLRPSVLIKC